MKRGILIGLFLMAIISVNVSAEENSSVDLIDGFEWLDSEMQQTNWGTNVEQLAWSILALRNAGYDVSAGVNKLKDLRQVDHWDDGDIKESALATLVLYKVGENVDLEVEWLKNKQKKNLRSGDGLWFIQFLTSGSEQVECNLFYENDEKIFFINDSEIVGESDCDLGENWVNFESCVQTTAGIHEEMRIDCDGTVESSLLYNSGTEYYIVDQVVPLEIENGCFYRSNTCSCSATQYGSWVLNEIGENYYTKPYLRSECNDEVHDNAFLFMLTGSRIYSDFLDVEMSDNDGSWEGNEELTSLAIIFLRDGSSVSLSTSKDWLESKQREEDGSWSADVKSTAMALYALTDEVSFVLPTNQTPSNTTCYNGIVDAGEDCDGSDLLCDGGTCEGCLCVPLPDCAMNSECAEDELCIGGVCVIDSGCDVDDDCSIGYYCTSAGECTRESATPGGCEYDSDCDPGKKCSSGSCVPVSDDEGGSWITWLIVIIVVLMGAAGGYFGYKQYFSKKKPALPGKKEVPAKSFSFGKKTTNYPPAQQKVPPSNISRTPVNTGKVDRAERELDNSLKKAKDLLGKK
ncbi:hypothetical protein HN908_02630 [Candidatus Woesearchaeota archaeon]|jgi:hypothetical protein|nr:hypothetical protein [Candidatus Woesearchaeota archaeon]